jgi:hypothetical protein
MVYTFQVVSPGPPRITYVFSFHVKIDREVTRVVVDGQFMASIY